MRLQSAIFDMDGTLLDSMFVWKELGTRMLRTQGYQPEEDLYDKVKEMTLRESAAYCKAAYGMPETVDQIIDMIVAEVEDFYATEVQLKPGVQKFLSLLKMEGVWMYVATNTDRRLAEIALKHTGIRSYFRGVLTCGEVGLGKAESAEIFERAMRRLQSQKRDTVIFEDSLHAIRTAARAGFRICGVYDAASEADQAEIQSLSETYIRSFEEMFQTETLA